MDFLRPHISHITFTVKCWNMSKLLLCVVMFEG